MIRENDEDYFVKLFDKTATVDGIDYIRLDLIDKLFIL